MYDIVFLSYGEANAEENWEKLKEKYPWAKRIDGVAGIFEAHIAAAKKCSTKYFWVIDADNIVKDTFDLNYTWPRTDPYDDHVAVWRAINSVNGLVYGYGGIKLLPRKKILNMEKPVADFTTSISERFHAMKQIASTTVINASEFDAWRSAFRECVKLASNVIDRHDKSENEQRLEVWKTIGMKKPFGEYCIMGAQEGFEYGSKFKDDPEGLQVINSYSNLRTMFESDIDVRLKNFKEIIHITTPEELVGTFSNAKEYGHLALTNSTTDDYDKNLNIIYGLEEMLDNAGIISLRKAVLGSFNHMINVAKQLDPDNMMLLDRIARTVRTYPDLKWEDVFSRGQTISKKWLVYELFNLEELQVPPLSDEGDFVTHLGIVYLCGGWYASLALMLLQEEDIEIDKIRSFDIDETCAEIAEKLNNEHVIDNWKFKATTMDICDINYHGNKYNTLKNNGEKVVLYDVPDTIINTSCEHIESFDYWWSLLPEDKLIILQSNDFFDNEGHINCVNTLAEFKATAPMEYLYAGEIKLQKYTRFMLIGYKRKGMVEGHMKDYPKSLNLAEYEVYTDGNDIEKMDSRKLQREAARALEYWKLNNNEMKELNTQADHDSQRFYKAVVQKYIDEHRGLPSLRGPAKSIKLVLNE